MTTELTINNVIVPEETYYNPWYMKYLAKLSLLEISKEATQGNYRDWRACLLVASSLQHKNLKAIDLDGPGRHRSILKVLINTIRLIDQESPHSSAGLDFKSKLLDLLERPLDTDFSRAQWYEDVALLFSSGKVYTSEYDASARIRAIIKIQALSLCEEGLKPENIAHELLETWPSWLGSKEEQMLRIHNQECAQLRKALEDAQQKLTQIHEISS